MYMRVGACAADQSLTTMASIISFKTYIGLLPVLYNIVHIDWLLNK